MTIEAKLEKFIDDIGLRYFKGKEFTPYWFRSTNGVQNSCPPAFLWPNIVPTLIVLDAMRHQIGAPVSLTSTYRNEAYNHAVGGGRTSQHLYFRAVDFQCSLGTPANWSAILKSFRGKKFYILGKATEFVFKGGIGVYKTFVHVDTRGSDANWIGA